LEGGGEAEPAATAELLIPQREAGRFQGRATPHCEKPAIKGKKGVALRLGFSFLGYSRPWRRGSRRKRKNRRKGFRLAKAYKNDDGVW